MISRRKILILAATGVSAGCTQENDSGGSGEDDTLSTILSIGDSAVKDDTFRITVLAKRRLSEIREEKETQAPSPKATFFAVQIRVEHIGETEESYPETDFAGSIQLIYRGEAIDAFPASKTFRDKEGRKYTHYRSQIFDKNYDTGAFPGTSVTGWVVYEMPAEFEIQETVLEVEQESGDTLRWKLTNVK